MAVDQSSQQIQVSRRNTLLVTVRLAIDRMTRWRPLNRRARDPFGRVTVVRVVTLTTAFGQPMLIRYYILCPLHRPSLLRSKPPRLDRSPRPAYRTHTAVILRKNVTSGLD